MPRTITDPVIRLRRSIDTEQTGTGCWEWLLAKDRNGYGVMMMHVNGAKKMRAAHRISYEILRGPIPAGLVIDHLCRNPSCVNPWHLEPVTNAENVRRGDSGRREREQTHCLRGHPFDERNTYVGRNSKGGRSRWCRACGVINATAYRRRKRERTDSH